MGDKLLKAEEFNNFGSNFILKIYFDNQNPIGK